QCAVPCVAQRLTLAVAREDRLRPHEPYCCDHQDMILKRAHRSHPIRQAFGPPIPLARRPRHPSSSTPREPVLWPVLGLAPNGEFRTFAVGFLPARRLRPRHLTSWQTSIAN